MVAGAAQANVSLLDPSLSPSIVAKGNRAAAGGVDFGTTAPYAAPASFIVETRKPGRRSRSSTDDASDLARVFSLEC